MVIKKLKNSTIVKGVAIAAVFAGGLYLGHKLKANKVNKLFNALAAAVAIEHTVPIIFHSTDGHQMYVIANDEPTALHEEAIAWEKIKF